MDDLEEFRLIFFQECQELLQSLEESLSAVESGNYDNDTVNAAFRAIHSIKGGAGAFGFDGMISFCHSFESVLDQVRNNRIELDMNMIKLCLRSKDIVADLVEGAQSGNSDLANIGTDVLAELAYTLEHNRAPAAGVVSASSSGGASENPAPAASVPQAVVETPAPEMLADDEPQERDVIIRFKPEADLIRAAIEPMKLIESLYELGCLNVDVISEDIPELEEFRADQCYLTWKFTLYTASEMDDIEDIFFFAKEYADIEYQDLRPEPQEQSEQSHDTSAQTMAAPTASGTPDVKTETTPAVQTATNGTGTVTGTGRIEQKAPAENAAATKAPITLRVDLQRIDRLVNMVGETVITQSVLAQQASTLSPEQHGGLLHAIESLSRQTRELQESVMSIRAQPVKNVFSRMNRLVRELSMSLNKEVKLVIIGENTEVDTTVIEELSDPLVHMIRNSMDHGMEPADERETLGKPREGTIKLSAEHRSGRIIITIRDDGRGINREKVLKIAKSKGLVAEEANPTVEEIENMIFLPGFSTADVVSSVSGRGVGMDVVRRNIQALGGRVFITSTPGRGTIFTMALPLTLAVLDGMVIRVGTENYIIPITSIIEASRIESHQLSLLPNGTRVINMRGQYIRMINMGNALNIELTNEAPQVIIVETEGYGQVGLLVDDLIGQQQIVIKSLETNYSRVEGISGATILGDGKVALILDTDAVAAMNLGSASYNGNQSLEDIKPIKQEKTA
jgi:two-component system, chemotaxis family, sensor kinase CheA